MENYLPWKLPSLTKSVIGLFTDADPQAAKYCAPGEERGKSGDPLIASAYFLETISGLQ